MSLFERDYWRRLWVVQEVFNARSITVYCGSKKLPWAVFKLASQIFHRHRADLDDYFPNCVKQGKADLHIAGANSPTLRCSSIKALRASPTSPPFVDLGEESMLEVLRACRRNWRRIPEIRYSACWECCRRDTERVPPDYNLSVKEVYTDVVDFLMTTTERVDVICEAIHFPITTNSANLPSFVPDWSHIPQTASLKQLVRLPRVRGDQGAVQVPRRPPQQAAALSHLPGHNQEPWHSGRDSCRKYSSII